MMLILIVHLVIFFNFVYVAYHGHILNTLTLNCIQCITQSCYSRQYLIFTHILCYFQSLETTWLLLLHVCGFLCFPCDLVFRSVYLVIHFTCCLLIISLVPFVWFMLIRPQFSLSLHPFSSMLSWFICLVFRIVFLCHRFHVSSWYKMQLQGGKEIWPSHANFSLTTLASGPF